MQKILLVEDDPDSRDMLRRRLQRLHYEVVCVGDGRTAIRAARSQRPDLILMDICLPEIDGYEAIAQIKGDRSTASIPIIALTVLSTIEAVRRTAAAGCEEFETKPILMNRLLPKIQRQLSEAEQALKRKPAGPSEVQPT
jgi:CheY-like chemotaxis protein